MTLENGPEYNPDLEPTISIEGPAIHSTLMRNAPPLSTGTRVTGRIQPLAKYIDSIQSKCGYSSFTIVFKGIAIAQTVGKRDECKMVLLMKPIVVPVDNSGRFEFQIPYELPSAYNMLININSCKIEYQLYAVSETLGIQSGIYLINVETPFSSLYSKIDDGVDVVAETSIPSPFNPEIHVLATVKVSAKDKIISDQSGIRFRVQYSLNTEEKMPNEFENWSLVLSYELKQEAKDWTSGGVARFKAGRNTNSINLSKSGVPYSEIYQTNIILDPELFPTGPISIPFKNYSFGEKQSPFSSSQQDLFFSNKYLLSISFEWISTTKPGIFGKQKVVNPGVASSLDLPVFVYSGRDPNAVAQEYAGTKENFMNVTRSYFAPTATFVG